MTRGFVILASLAVFLIILLPNEAHASKMNKESKSNLKVMRCPPPSVD